MIETGYIDRILIKKLKFGASSNNEKYNISGICYSLVYTKESEVGYLSGLYYLISWSSYL